MAETVHDLPRLYEEGALSIDATPLNNKQHVSRSLRYLITRFTIVVWHQTDQLGRARASDYQQPDHPMGTLHGPRHPFNLSPLQPYPSQERTIVPNEPLVTEVVRSRTE
jgi:hypothetical protein